MPALDIPSLEAASEGLWREGGIVLDSVHEHTLALNRALTDFLKKPNKASLTAVRQQWLRAHRRYQRFYLFTLMGEVSPVLFGGLKDFHGNIDAHPIEPGYLDYFDVYRFSGIVNDIAVPVNAAAIRKQHGFSDARDVALGFHALEYLLWGEHGDRPLEDWIVPAVNQGELHNELQPHERPVNRRRAYAQLLLNLLQDDVEALKRAWQDLDGDLHQAFTSLEAGSRIQLVKRVIKRLLDVEIVGTQLTPLVNGQGDDLLQNRFAGENAGNILAGLWTIEHLLIKAPTPLSPWVLPEEGHRQRLEDSLGALRTTLEAMPSLWTDAHPEVLRKLQKECRDLSALF